MQILNYAVRMIVEYFDRYTVIVRVILLIMIIIMATLMLMMVVFMLMITLLWMADIKT